MLKSLFTENISLKLIALCLAILLKLYFFSADNFVQETLELPISLHNIPGPLMVVEPQDVATIKVQVKLRGPQPLVEPYRSRNPQLRIEFPTLHARGDGQMQQPVKLRRFLTIPSGIDLVDITPADINFVFDRRIKKELLVTANYTGQPAPGYRLEDVRVSPESVIATGPEGELDQIAAVQTEELDISRFSSTQRLNLTLLQSNPLISYSDELVTVEVKLSPIYAERTYNNVPINVRAPNGYAATVEPSKATVVLSGPIRFLDLMDINTLELYADASDKSAGEHLVELKMDIPRTLRNVYLASTTPQQVTLRLVNKNE